MLLNAIKSFASPHKPEPKEKNAAPNSSAAQTDVQNSQNTKSQSARPLDERFFLVGVFYDVLKTIPRILTGSYLTSILSNILKDSNQSMESVIYKTTVDDLSSRFLCDIGNTLAVRVFNGKTKFFGKSIPRLPAEIASQILATPVVTLSRTMTRMFNVNRKSAKHNSSYKEEELEEAIKKQPFYQWARNLSLYYRDNLKAKSDALFSAILGVKDGEEVKDSQGNIVKKANGKPLIAEPEVNYGRLGGITLATFFGSMFLLPKNSQAVGFDDVKGPIRGFFNVLWTTFCRLQTTLISSATGMHMEGKNFDACLETAVQDKTIVPLVQNTMDAVAAVLSYKVPFFNGATMSIILRTAAELPVSFLKSGLMRIAKESRVSDEWSYLSHKVLKPFTKGMETITRPILKFLAKNVYWRLPIPFVFESGIFNPKIKNMYDVDIQLQEHEAKEGADKFEGNFFKTAGLLGKKCLTIFAEMFELFSEGREQSKKITAENQNIIKAHETKILEEKVQEKVQERLAAASLHEAGAKERTGSKLMEPVLIAA